MVIYRKATVNDISFLTDCRLKLLRSANKLGEDADLSVVKNRISCYYRKGIITGEHIAFIAFDDDRFVGTGGICFYRVLPTYHNPSGEKAYIINMFTEEKYRKQGIATKILDLLVQESLRRGVSFISLEATEMGKPIYEKYGFALMPAEMQLKNDAFSTP